MAINAKSRWNRDLDLFGHVSLKNQLNRSSLMFSRQWLAALPNYVLMYKKYINKLGVPEGYVHQILLIMRLISIILIMGIMQVSASTFAQRITLSEKNAALSKVFDRISDQCGYNFVFTSDLLKGTKPVTINVKNTELDKVLEQIFANQPVSFSIEDKTVVIQEKAPSFLDNVRVVLAAIDVRGVVTDGEGLPLPGATVTVKGTGKKAVTNGRGEFYLQGVDEKAVLVISYLGYETKEVNAAKDLGKVQLALADSKLEEVEINAGYYTVKDRERTGSISRITSKDIEKQPVNNVLQAMQANIPGVQIVQLTGLPGGGFSIKIRGKNSISNGSEPFYIIDGIPFTATGLGGSKDNANSTRATSPLASINPNDIESIEVLKDADATAIYGSRGANGVVLITTKKGKQGKARATVSLNQGISRVGNKLDLMNTEQYLGMRREAFANDKLPVLPTDYDLNGNWDQNRYTDWQKELIGGTAPSNNIQATLSGGTNNMVFLIGGNYYREGTVFPSENSYKRASGNFSLQYTSDNKKFNVSFDSNYSQINSNLFTTDITAYIFLAPNYPALLNEKGQLNWGYNSTGIATMYINPIAETQKPFDAKTNNLISNAIVSYTIIPDLKVKASIGYTKMDRQEISMLPLTTFSPALNYGPTQRQSFFTNNSFNSWIAEAQANWSKKIGMGKFNILIGTTFQENITEGQEIQAAGYTSDALMGNIAAASTLTSINRAYFQYRYTGIFGRINYAFKDKYILNATARRDGSSRFGTNNRFANFGAIGAAWVISNEPFFKENLPFISFAKLRGSYGITGNDQIGDYAYLSLWKPSGTYQGISSTVPSQLKNPNLAWEINKKTEAALELVFFGDRINLSVDRYINRSSNQLIFTPLTPSAGFNSYRDNLPAKVSNTGWEFALSTKNFSNKKFSWSTSVNFTIPKNKLISFPGLSNSSQVSTLEIGMPLTIRKLYNTYVDAQSGLFVTEDYDKNGIIESNNDARNIHFVGREFYGGLQNSLSYLGIQLDFLFQFVKQSGTSSVNYISPGLFGRTNPISNQTNDVTNNHWKNLGDISRFQKYSTLITNFAKHSFALSSGSLAFDDASFIKLKNVSISYNLPLKFTQKMKLNNAKFFLQGQDLLTITKYKGLDPETLSYVNIPTLQTFVAGIQLTF